MRYTIDADRAFKPYACHCKECQSRSGSAFVVQMLIPSEFLKIEGELLEGTNFTPKGAEVRQYACPKCLTRIYGANLSRPGLVTLRAGTLDDSHTLVPATHIWTQSKQPWVVIPDDVPSYETQPENPLEWVMPLAPPQQS